MRLPRLRAHEIVSIATTALVVGLFIWVAVSGGLPTGALIFLPFIVALGTWYFFMFRWDVGDRVTRAEDDLDLLAAELDEERRRRQNAESEVERLRSRQR